MKKRLFIAFFALCSLTWLFGAEITIPNLEVSSRGSVVNGTFGITSSMAADISLSGGYKYAITLGLGVEIPDLEKALSYGRFDFDNLDPTKPEDLDDRLNNQAVVSIRSVKAVIREVFGTPLEIGFFIGHHEKLGSGDEFQEYFGSDPIGTGLRGFFYYPDGLNDDPLFRFNGAIHTIKGTGLAFKAYLGNIIPALYVYHDLSFPEDRINGSYVPGVYSGDFKLLANGEYAKVEIFLGGTYITEEKPVFRGGALAWFGSGPLSLLFQAGIPYWEAGSNLDIDNCYFLMEPRLQFEKAGASLTFFYHPVYYMNRVIEEGGTKANGRADINFRLFYGNLSKSAFEAGLETLINLEFQNGEDLTLWVAPFVSAVTSGLHWDFTVRFNPRYYWDKGTLMEAFIAFRAAF